VEVNGPNTHPVYRFLRSSWGKEKNGEAKVIPWNFAKFLIN
jgi:glutathione peroxidase-family protein